MDNTAKRLYYPVWISPGRRAGGWSWGRPCDTAAEAGYLVRQEIARGASLGCVVEMAGVEKTPLAEYVSPRSARRLIEHWEQLWDATDHEA